MIHTTRSLTTTPSTRTQIHQARELLLSHLANIDQQLLHATSDLVCNTETHDTLNVILDQLLTLLQAEGVALATLDSERGGVVIEQACGVWEPLRGSRGRGSTIIDIDSVVLPTHTICMPLTLLNRPLATLCIGRTTPITGSDLDILTSLADIATRVLVNRWHTRLEHQEVYDAALEGWVRALELRDNETEGHTRRVTDMTIQLARALEVSEDEIIHIRRGALLHDIGKIAIPDSILLKAGPLTDEEWHIMRQHPLYACDMLCSIPFLQPALDIPRHHHERWDGTGYPDGLHDTQIPLAARIFAVVDVWDALRYDRPYRKGWENDRVLDYIHCHTGTHFDPHIAQVFLNQSLMAGTAGKTASLHGIMGVA